MNIFKELDGMFGDLFDEGQYWPAYCPKCKREYEVTWDAQNPHCMDCNIPLEEKTNERKRLIKRLCTRRSVGPMRIVYGSPALEIMSFNPACMRRKDDGDK